MLTKINYTKLIFLLHMLKNMEQKPENEKIYTELEVYIILYILTNVECYKKYKNYQDVMKLYSF